MVDDLALEVLIKGAEEEGDEMVQEMMPALTADEKVIGKSQNVAN